MLMMMMIGANMLSFEQRDNQICRGKHIFQGSILGICGTVFVDFFVEGEEGVGFLLRRRRRHIVAAVLCCGAVARGGGVSMAVLIRW